MKSPIKNEEPSDTSTIEGVLRSLIQQYGKDLYKKENSSKLKNLIADFAGKHHDENLEHAAE